MAKQHYDTMATDDICSLPISEISTDDAFLFMWATFPNIGEALKVIEAWGFIYKTAAFVWVKRNKKTNSFFWGMGAYTRANAEICLIAIKKDVKVRKAIKRRDIHQILYEPIEQHSKKPAIVREKIVHLLGDIPRIELFARQYADGWDCWGNEV